MRRYIEAVIRLHTGRPVGSWADQELLDSFCVLPVPAVGLEEFAAGIGAELPEDPYAKANRLALATMRQEAADDPGLVKVETGGPASG